MSPDRDGTKFNEEDFKTQLEEQNKNHGMTDELHKYILGKHEETKNNKTKVRLYFLKVLHTCLKGRRI